MAGNLEFTPVSNFVPFFHGVFTNVVATDILLTTQI